MTTLDQRAATAEPTAQPTVGRDQPAEHECLCEMVYVGFMSGISRCRTTVSNPDQPLCDWCMSVHLNDPNRVVSSDLITGARA